MPTAGGPEYLSFDGVDALPAFPLNTVGGLTRAALWVSDYLPLRRAAPKVGGNRPIPGAAGRRYVPRELDELSVALTQRINGRQDTDGTPFDDWVEGARVNLDEYLAVVVDPLIARAVTFHRYEGDTATGTIMVEDFDVAIAPNSAGDVLFGTLSFKVMAGALPVVGS